MPSKKPATGSVIERIRAAQQPIHEHLAQARARASAGKAEPLHLGAKNVKILVGRKRKAGLRARIRKHFAGIMHRVITPTPAATVQITSFRGIPEISGVTNEVASDLGKVVKAAMGDGDEVEKPRTLRIVGLRIS